MHKESSFYFFFTGLVFVVNELRPVEKFSKPNLVFTYAQNMPISGCYWTSWGQKFIYLEKKITFLRLLSNSQIVLHMCDFKCIEQISLFHSLHNCSQ